MSKYGLGLGFRFVICRNLYRYMLMLTNHTHLIANE